MKKKVMISQPMSGLPLNEIEKTMNEVLFWIQKNGYEFVNSYFPDYNNTHIDEIIHKNVDYLGRALQALAKADILYMCKGWEDARGCVVEHKVAELYNIEIIYED